MTNSLTRISAALFLWVAVISCDRPPCEMSNEVFSQHTADSRTYKAELARQLKLVDADNLSYWIEGYQEKNKDRYIFTRVQGDGLCAVMVMKLGEASEGIEGVIRSKGKGYRGAQISGLKFDVRQNDKDTEFIFRSADSIVD